MTSSIVEKLDDANCATFGRAFLQAFVDPAFGVRSKSEVDLLAFEALRDFACACLGLGHFGVTRRLE